MNFNYSNKGKKIKKNINEEIKWLSAILIGYLIISQLILFNGHIPSSSMVDTLQVKDRVLSNRLAYIVNQPKRSDVVVFFHPDQPNKHLIKRIIGLPGEVIRGNNGIVYINNQPLDEPYLLGSMIGSFGPIKIPINSYFMMGDNRNFSADARVWKQPFVYKDNLIAKAMFVYYPIFKKLP
ncbi:MAG: signal peptidase I [Clostridiales bacterium]|nr:signal peptidase I [Clostridiales bacterium]